MMKKISIVGLTLFICAMLGSTALAADMGRFHGHPYQLLIVTKNTGWRVAWIRCDRGDTFDAGILDNKVGVDCEGTGCDCQVGLKWQELNYYLSRTPPKELFAKVQYAGQEENYNPILTPPEEKSAVIQVRQTCNGHYVSSGTVTVTPVHGARLNYQTFPCGTDYVPPYGMVGITE